MVTVRFDNHEIRRFSKKNSLLESDCCVEDEGAREEAAGSTGETGGSARKGAQGLTEEGPKSHSSTFGIPKRRCYLSENKFYMFFV